jgi:hypothetical protein
MVRVVKKDDVPTILIELEWKTDAVIPLEEIYDAEYFHIFGFTLHGADEPTDSTVATPATKEDEAIVSFDNDGNRIVDAKQLGGDKISGPYAMLHGLFHSVEKVASSGTVSPNTSTEIDEDALQAIYVPPLPTQSKESVETTPSGSTVVLKLTLDDPEHISVTSSLTDYINQMKVANADNIQCFVKSGLDYHTVESIALDLYKQITYLGTKNIEFKDLSLSDVYYICGNYVIVKSGDGFVAKGGSEEKSQAVRYNEIIRDMMDETVDETKLKESALEEKKVWWL